MSLIVCQNLNMEYDNILAVSDVTFEVSRGDYLCIVGENGSGKSTLMKGLLGLMPPTSGHIHFDDIDRTQIGYLPQQTMVQKDFPASVFEVVLSGCLNRRGLHPFYTRKDKERVRGNLERLEITRLARVSYRDLSGGQQQRVLLARALCAAERLLLLDEPVTGLDPVVTAEFYALIKRLNRDDGVTIIMVSHDIASAVKYATKILHMDVSSQFFGSTEQYRKTELFQRMLGGDAHDNE